MNMQTVDRKVERANRSQLARELGVTRNHVSQVLNGRGTPSLKLAGGIARGLGVSLDELSEYFDKLEKESVLLN
jgi:transcriptional regulator with XRE-family HTH domain